MSWAWYDWRLTWLTNHRPSVLWHCWLGHVTRKIVSEMTYNVSSGTLNSTVPYLGMPACKIVLFRSSGTVFDACRFWHYQRLVCVSVEVRCDHLTIDQGSCCNQTQILLNEVVLCVDNVWSVHVCGVQDTACGRSESFVSTVWHVLPYNFTYRVTESVLFAFVVFAAYIFHVSHQLQS